MLSVLFGAHLQLQQVSTHPSPSAVVRSAGMSAGGVFGLLLLSVCLTAGGMYAVYQVHLRKRMHQDMRNILEEYVPLNSAPGPPDAGRKFQLIPDSFTDVVTPRISTAVTASTPLSDGLTVHLSDRSESSS